MAFGVFCVEDDAFCTNAIGEIVTYRSIPETEAAAAAAWRGVDARTYLVLQVKPNRRPCGWSPPTG